jgi:hypothetical protein
MITLVSSCCYNNKVPQTGWLKTTKMYSLAFWKLEIQNQVWEVHAPAESLGRRGSLSLETSLSMIEKNEKKSPSQYKIC